jgi:hypothetical protein
MTRFASTKEAIKEQQMIDPVSLRQIDYAETNFAKNPRGHTNFHTLNLYSVNNDDFYKNIAKYARINDYKYLFWDPAYPSDNETRINQFKDLAKNSVLIKSFGSDQKKYSLRDGDFGSPLGLFELENFGPEIEIFQLRK